MYHFLGRRLGQRYLHRHGHMETMIESTSNDFLPPPTFLPFEVPTDVAEIIQREETTFMERARSFQGTVIK
jgi:hypothetical protein